MSHITVTLNASDLWSKFGFCDGDLFTDFSGLPHEILVKAVRKHLLPLLPGIEVYEIQTIHNPIRVKDCDGYSPAPEQFENISVTFDLSTLWE